MEKGKGKPVLFVVLFLLSVAGLCASIYLAASHYSILSGQRTGASFCTVSEVVDCDAVAASPYSEIYQIPWASFGALVYLILLCFSLLGLLFHPLSTFSLRFMFSISLLCILFDAYLAFIGFAVLKLVCIVCIFTYLVNLGILIVSKKALGDKVSNILKGTLRSLPFLDASLGDKRPMARLFHCLNLAIILFGLAGILGIRWHFVGDREERVAKIMESLSQQRPVTVALENSPRLGPENPKVTIVEFSDFRCPYCKEFASALKMVQKRYSRDLALYFKHYPLDNLCNPYMQRPFHPEACKLAQIGVCVERSGKFWEMDEALFNSGKPTDASLRKALEARGLNPEDIYSCSEEPWTRDRVMEDIQEGRKLGVRATPTMFINGYRLEGAFDSYTLSLLVEKFLERKRP
jgi:protein-disulfide isomerase/uncharacterized membrane protein